MCAPTASGARAQAGERDAKLVAPGGEPLFTVIVAEAAVRSALAGRLAMDGANMCTALGFDERRPPPVRDAAAILVTDQATVDMHSGGVVALLHDASWHRIIVLTPGAAATSEDPRLLYVERGDAVAATIRLRTEWRRDG